jgi:hypothetical protein
MNHSLLLLVNCQYVSTIVNIYGNVCIQHLTTALRTDGGFCHQGPDTEIAPKNLRLSKHDHSFCRINVEFMLKSGVFGE